MSPRTVWFLVPDSIDDPARVSGGNVYDQQLRDGLVHGGWEVRMLTAADGAQAGAALAAVPPGALVLVDGLVAGWAPDAVEAAAGIRLIILAHMVAAAFPDAAPESLDAERRVLAVAAGVIATSGWTARELTRRGMVGRERVAVARPGALGAAQRFDASCERELLCVGVIAPHKGQDVLLAALDRLVANRRPRLDEWTCTLAGATTTDIVFAAGIARASARFDGRVRMPGVLNRGELDDAYRRAGVVVAPSRAESFGLAIADARSRGLPVIASDVGGVREALAGGGALLVPPDDPEALAHSLWRWLADARLRGRLRAAAAQGQSRAPRWRDTVAQVDRVLAAA